MNFGKRYAVAHQKTAELIVVRTETWTEPDWAKKEIFKSQFAYIGRKPFLRGQNR